MLVFGSNVWWNPCFGQSYDMNFLSTSVSSFTVRFKWTTSTFGTETTPFLQGATHRTFLLLLCRGYGWLVFAFKKDIVLSQMWYDFDSVPFGLQCLRNGDNNPPTLGLSSVKGSCLRWFDGIFRDEAASSLLSIDCRNCLLSLLVIVEERFLFFLFLLIRRIGISCHSSC